MVRILYGLPVLLLLLFNDLCAQPWKKLAEKHLDTLCSPAMHGRGYVFDGDRKASLYIRDYFKAYHLKPFNDNYFQYFDINVNTFPAEMALKINGKALEASNDYVIYPASKSGKGSYPVKMLDTTIFDDEEKKAAYFRHFDHEGMLAYPSWCVDKIQELSKVNIAKIYSTKGLIELTEEKPVAGISTDQYLNPYFKVYKKCLDKKPLKADFNVKAEHKQHYTTQNVIGYLPGTVQRDSFIVITAHYDHLGHMGKATWFPGANDNASGTAFLIELAHYFSQHEDFPYSVAFIAFSGEEAGLLGSKYYTQNPLFDLDKIKFLLNIDMMGNGQKGITVVNGKVHTDAFDLLKTINQEGNYVPDIKKRGAAANSDHHYFSEKGVKSFFIYSRGPHNYYHDIQDNADNLRLEKFNDLFKMITNFIEEL